MTKRKPDADSPEVSAELFKRGKFGSDHVPSALVTGIRAFRGKQKAPTKEMISLRVDRDTVEAYRRTGKGWQGRMNDTLARAAKRLDKRV